MFYFFVRINNFFNKISKKIKTAFLKLLFCGTLLNEKYQYALECLFLFEYNKDIRDMLDKGTGSEWNTMENCIKPAND